MKVAIIGAGFTGLATAYELAAAGCEVTVLEKNNQPGGLASGFTYEDWSWALEHHYHHVFETDTALKNWLKRLKLLDQLFFLSTKSYTLTEKGMNPLDSPLSLLAFPGLSFMSKIRTGLTLAFLKVWPWGQELERFTAGSFIKTTMGEKSWKLLWQPLFAGKFGDQLAEEINAAWFWARINTRSKKLGYFKGGFLQLAKQLVKKIQEKGVEFRFETAVERLEKVEGKFKLFYEKDDSKSETFDQVIFTGNSQQFLGLIEDQFSKKYIQQLNELESLAAMTTVLVLDKPFFDQDIYWLNINRSNWPFLALVEHTNYIDGKHYSDQHLLYIAKYIDPADELFKLDQAELLAKYDSYLSQLSPDYKQHIKKIFAFKAKYAQPVVKKNHSRKLPSVITPVKGLFFAGMEHIYPFDRGINYAVKLGRDTAQKVLHQAQ